MKPKLNDIEIRILGSLIEKELTTPEYYPLSLNSLINACNQKSNRSPVVSYDEKTILTALDSLKKEGFVSQSDVSRVIKYEQIFTKSKNLLKSETAIISILFLRGSQTLGEIKLRTERIYQFKNFEELEEIIKRLEEVGYITKLSRQKGHKEPRYIHLFSDPSNKTDNIDYTSDDSEDLESTDLESLSSKDIERLNALEKKVDVLYEEIGKLKKAFNDFKIQFE
ncbi:MAG: YceH family protein [Desulfobacterales bacterium]|nr:YceH family protein [Desulfobacterales bacterium]